MRLGAHLLQALYKVLVYSLQESLVWRVSTGESLLESLEYHCLDILHCLVDSQAIIDAFAPQSPAVTHMITL